MATSLAGELDRINLGLEVVTGMELDQGRAVGVLDAGTWQARRRRLEDLGDVPEL